MKIALAVAALLCAAGAAQACDMDYMYDVSFVETQVQSGAATEAEARAAQAAALAYRDQNMAQAQQAFMRRFGGTLSDDQPSASATLVRTATETQSAAENADRRTLANASYQ